MPGYLDLGEPVLPGTRSAALWLLLGLAEDDVIENVMALFGLPESAARDAIEQARSQVRPARWAISSAER